MTDKTLSAADSLGAKKSTNPIPNEVGSNSMPSHAQSIPTQNPNQQMNVRQNPSMLSSEGAIGKHFNPDGAVGSIGQKVGGPFDRFGVVGSQFDAAQNGIAGHVERAVDGPRNPAGSSK